MHSLLALLSGWGAPFVSAPASVGSRAWQRAPCHHLAHGGTWAQIPPLPSEGITNRCQHQGACLRPQKGPAPSSGISQILQCISSSLILAAAPSSGRDWLMTPILLVKSPRSERPPGLPGPRGTAGIACGFGPGLWLAMLCTRLDPTPWASLSGSASFAVPGPAGHEPYVPRGVIHPVTRHPPS